MDDEMARIMVAKALGLGEHPTITFSWDYLLTAIKELVGG